MTARAPKMSVHAALTCLVLLASQAAALDCNFLQLHQQRFNLQSLELLKEMRTKPSPECLESPPAFAFPAKILGIHEPWLATKVVHQTLSGFLDILSDDLLPTGWAAAPRERFLKMLHAQAESVQECLGEGGAAPRSMEKWKHLLRLKKYFQRIRTFLQTKGHMKCTSENMRLEFQAAFVYLDILTKRIKTWKHLS
ncbi:interferon beta-like [Varanus komodoensis]|uniref:interferon beta-like n=1 Tax=Varanus komodoensis TaxID=61221 RepID=UPI001CF7A453|nr:interferon beta-like [Varanus komodoensis]